MNIVVVDGATLNPGDLSWQPLLDLGPTQVYERSTRQESLERCRDAQITITNKVVFDKEVMNALPQLRYIGVTATGHNIIDIAAAKERGIVVTNVPTYGTTSVAQMTFSLLLELAQHVGYHAQTVAQGRWCASTNFCYWDRPLIELAGLKMGIIGCGRIGQAVAALAAAFGMRVAGYDVVKPKQTSLDFEDLDTLLKTSDVISLHCPLTPQTQHMINSKTLALMKPSALLINTSRGPLVHEQDLAEALNAGRIAGAGLDVLSSEPPSRDNPLLTARNCYITPHIAWATLSARQRLLDITINNVRGFLAGKPLNVVS